MPSLVVAKASDIGAWRAIDEFSADFRQSLLDLSSREPSLDAERLFSDAGLALESLASKSDEILSGFGEEINEISVAPSAALLRTHARKAFSTVYGHFSRFSSAPAFFSLNDAILRASTESVISLSLQSMGLEVLDVPHFALKVLGPAGRKEFSPFCTLQLMMVHEETGKKEIIPLLSRLIHENFIKAGFLLDDVVTPRNPAWCSSNVGWIARIEEGLSGSDSEELIDILRLADMRRLNGSGEFIDGFALSVFGLISGSRPALLNLVNRLLSLSNGLGIMGGLKTERSGANKGKFRLLEYGLLPLSASVSAMALMNGVDKVSTPARIRALVRGYHMNVDISEKLIESWHLLNELRILCEMEAGLDKCGQDVLFLNTEKMEHIKFDSLKSSLETVGMFQRQVGITMTGMEEMP